MQLLAAVSAASPEFCISLMLRQMGFEAKSFNDRLLPALSNLRILELPETVSSNLSYLGPNTCTACDSPWITRQCDDMAASPGRDVGQDGQKCRSVLAGY